MSISDELRNIRDHLRTGRFGQREVWERQLEDAAAESERQAADIDQLLTERQGWLYEIERLQAALHEIDQWSRAYPFRIFPEPDFEKAHELLQVGGMTVDAISATAIRRAIEGVGEIARRALEEKE